jgi:hypothetical protein
MSHLTLFSSLRTALLLSIYKDIDVFHPTGNLTLNEQRKTRLLLNLEQYFNVHFFLNKEHFKH